MKEASLLRSMLIILALAVSLVTDTALARDAQSISIAWKRAANQPICLAMSPEADHYATVDRDSTVRYYDRSGRLLWRQEVPNATDVLIAKNGQTVLVYAKLNPAEQEVRFFRSDGRQFWKHKVEGEVWSGDISQDGTRAAITSGEGYVYIYRPDPKRPTYRRWRLDGTGYCVRFDGASERVIVATKRQSGLACYDANGRFQWRYRQDDDEQYQIRTSADGRRILGLLSGTQQEPGVEFCLWDSGGKRLWKRALDGFDARALISPDSRYMAVSYASSLSDAGGGIVERKVAVYSSTGQVLWDKGGLFFGPHLVALSPQGSSVIASDGEKCLYTIDKRGKLVSKLTMPGTIRRTLSSDDGRRILVYCGDGWLYLLRVD